MELNRIPSFEEIKLIEKLIEQASVQISLSWKKNLQVRPMQDGNMGSLRLMPDVSVWESQISPKIISEYMVKDLDGGRSTRIFICGW